MIDKTAAPTTMVNGSTPSPCVWKIKHYIWCFDNSHFSFESQYYVYEYCSHFSSNIFWFHQKTSTCSPSSTSDLCSRPQQTYSEFIQYVVKLSCIEKYGGLWENHSSRFPKTCGFHQMLFSLLAFVYPFYFLLFVRKITMSQRTQLSHRSDVM